MVVLAATICTRSGKALLCRQFRDLSKDRITALLANFPSLISEANGQHTTVEDESVRYVYQPLEEFYVVLITNKASNILQDLDTLQLFASTISDLLRIVDEREVFDNAFEIILAVDEIISLGYKDNASLGQIQSYLKMDSHEEKIQEIIERNKELEATEERKRRAKEIRRKELANRAAERHGDSMGLGGGDFNSMQSSLGPQSYQPTYQPAPIVETNAAQKPSLSKPMPSRGGLQLGKKPARASHAPAKEPNQPLLSEAAPVFQTHKPDVAEVAPNSSLSASPAISASQKVHNDGILITINEKVTASLNRDGSISLSEVKGDLQLRINSPELAHSKLLLKTGDKSSGIQYKTHPNVDRALFNSLGEIGLKDKSKSFPANDQALGVLRWRVVGKQDDSSLVPLLVTAWVGLNDDGIAQVTLEYELTSEFIESHETSSVSGIENIQIVVPISTHEVHLNSESNEGVSYDNTEDGVVFTIDAISCDDPQGSFEFTIPTPEEDALFPMELLFELKNTSATETDNSFGKVQVIDVVSIKDEQSLPFDLHSLLVSESFQIA